MSKQIPVSDEAVVDGPGEGNSHVVAAGVAYLRLAIVNAVVVGGAANDEPWVLVDAGIAGMSSRIRRAAAKHFGESRPPTAIILTHGHFDHIGSLEHLAERWDVPVYAHADELPFLTGERAYPPPDPTVGGGLMAFTSPLFPGGPFDFSRRIRPLPTDGSIPGMPGWRWLATPGHTPGHVSLWRKADRTLIAGDAFITTKQESAYAVLTQEAEIHGPPAYYTPNWAAAGASVRRGHLRLADLNPRAAAYGVLGARALSNRTVDGTGSTSQRVARRARRRRRSATRDRTRLVQHRARPCPGRAPRERGADRRRGAEPAHSSVHARARVARDLLRHRHSLRQEHRRVGSRARRR